LHCGYGHVKEACPRFIERSGLFVAVACGAFFVPVLFKFNHEHQGDEINPFSFVTKQTKPKERKSRATVINTDDPKKQAHKRYGEEKKETLRASFVVPQTILLFILILLEASKLPKSTRLVRKLSTNTQLHRSWNVMHPLLLRSSSFLRNIKDQ
jgi:hypothetical protein